MRKLLLILICTLSFTTIYAQQIQGTVTDTDGKPIEFVSVGVKGTSTGTISNEQGQFLLAVKALPVTLVLSHLSYIPQEIIVNDDHALSIILKSQSIQLHEVTVGNPALALMQLASEKAYKDVNVPHIAKAFSRQIMAEGDKPAFFAENFLDVQWQNWGITKYNITNARYLQKPDAVSYTNVTLLSYIFSAFAKNSILTSPISHKPDSLYKFTIKETFKNNDQEITVINCQLKDPDQVKHLTFIGDIYINSDTYDVLKTDGTLLGFKLNLSGPYKSKLKELKLISQFKLDNKGANVLDYSSFTIKYDMKLLGLGVKVLSYSTKIFILDYTPSIDPASLTEIDLKSKEKDEDRIKKRAYDADFWKNNAVIRRTQAEEDAIATLENQKNKQGTAK
ncbi:MAG: carboxypeptidase-like regulatory domain-containing protein [Bacteroidota bacterium]